MGTILLCLLVSLMPQTRPAADPDRAVRLLLMKDDAEALKERLHGGLAVDAKFNVDHITLLQMAGLFGSSSCGELLKDRGATVDAWSAAALGWEPALLAALDSDPASALRRVRGDAPIHVAAGRGHTEAVRILLRRGVAPNLEDVVGRTALHRAAACGSAPVVRMLLDAGADVNKTSLRGTPLHWAIGSSEMTKLLLEAGADVHITTREGSTPLEWAASWGNAEVVALLASKVKQQEVLDRALYDTAMGSSDESAARVAAVLLEAGANVNSRHPGTPLHRAASAGVPGLCKVLLEAGADVNAVGPLGRTPLHHATVSGNPDVVQMLLRYGADRQLRDDNGRRPLD